MLLDPQSILINLHMNILRVLFEVSIFLHERYRKDGESSDFISSTLEVSSNKQVSKFNFIYIQFNELVIKMLPNANCSFGTLVAGKYRPKLACKQIKCSHQGYHLSIHTMDFIKKNYKPVNSGFTCFLFGANKNGQSRWL